MTIESQMMAGSPSDDTIDIGAATSKRLTMTVKNNKTDLRRFAGARLWLYVSLRLENGAFEDVPMGKFFIDNKSVSRVGDQVTFSAYDGMILLHYELTNEIRAELKGKTALEAAQILCGGRLAVSPGYNYGLGIHITDGKITAHSCNADGVISDVSASEYHVVAAVGYDDGEDGKTTQKLYIDGEYIGTNSNNYSASAHAREIYGGYMAINGIARPEFKFDSDLNLYLKYFGMGSVAHTDEQIKTNCEWFINSIWEVIKWISRQL